MLTTGFTAKRSEIGSTANLVWEAVSYLGGGVGIPFWNHYNAQRNNT
jgi:Na+/H+ antiporter NhaD/arsenite permease-like protein